MNATRTIIDDIYNPKLSLILDKYYYISRTDHFIFRFGDDMIEYVRNFSDSPNPLLYVGSLERAIIISGPVDLKSGFNIFQEMIPIVFMKNYKKQMFTISQRIGQ